MKITLVDHRRVEILEKRIAELEATQMREGAYMRRQYESTLRDIVDAFMRRIEPPIVR